MATARAERYWQRLLQGRHLWAWQLDEALDAVPRGDTERPLALAKAMVELPSPGQRGRAAEMLERLVGWPGYRAELTEACVEYVMAALSPDDRGPFGLFESVANWSWRRHCAAVALHTRLPGDHTRRWRALLAGPVLGVATHQVSETVIQAFGPKLAAIERIVVGYQPGDTELLLNLARRCDEPAAVRRAAVMAVRHHLTAEQMLDLLPTLLAVGLPEGLFDGRPDWSTSLRIALAPPLVAALSDRSLSQRQRAHDLLLAVGGAARDELSALVRTADHWATRQHAEELLARIDRAALREAHALREADGRSLSLARPQDANADRGLSRSDP